MLQSTLTIKSAPRHIDGKGNNFIGPLMPNKICLHILSFIVVIFLNSGCNTMKTRPDMVVYLYRWKLKPEKIQQFEKAWSRVTLELREKAGSLGSRLHRGNDGIFYGYAQWPSQQMREQANLSSDEIKQARLMMSDAVEEQFPAVILQPVADYLKH